MKSLALDAGAVPDAVTARDILRTHSQRFSVTRLLLIVLVVYVHFPLMVPEMRDLAAWSALTPAYIANQTVLRFSVTILTIMSGYIMFATGADMSPIETIRKKVKTLVIPFLCWNLPLALAMFAAQSMDLMSGQRLDLASADLATWADALFALTTRPVNYPLYFLRDLFVIAVIAVVISGIARRYIVPVIAVCLLVSEYNLDGYLILRTPMLTAFFIGAAIAIWRVELDRLDKGFALFAALLVITCVVHYYTPSDHTGLLITILGGLTVWTGVAQLQRFSWFSGLGNLAKYSFPIYLIHGIVLFGVLALGFAIPPTGLGLVLWLTLPFAIAVASGLAFYVFKRIMPGFASFVTGGRAA